MTAEPRLTVLPRRPDPAVVHACREMLAEAEAGNIVSVAFVAMTPTNGIITDHGGQRMDLLAGQLSLLLHNVLARMREGATHA